MVYNEYENTDIMSAFFKGKISIDDISGPKSKMVELGKGNGIGHIHGSYSQYIKILRERVPKENGIISIGKSVIEKDNIFSMPDITDKFTVGDVPHILIMHYNIINPITVKVLWKNSEDEIISDQYYEICGAHSLNYDWWEQYGTYFIGPENLEEGNYNVEIISTEVGREDIIKNLVASLDFTVAEPSNKDLSH